MPWRDESTPTAFLPALRLQGMTDAVRPGQGRPLLVAEIVVEMRLWLKYVSRWGRPEEP